MHLTNIAEPSCERWLEWAARVNSEQIVREVHQDKCFYTIRNRASNFTTCYELYLIIYVHYSKDKARNIHKNWS